MKIQIVETRPRDGFQNEKKTLTASTKIQLIGKPIDAGVRRIEVGSFVSADWVPQMANTAQVCRSLHELPMPKRAAPWCFSTKHGKFRWRIGVRRS